MVGQDRREQQQVERQRFIQTLVANNIEHAGKIVAKFQQQDQVAEDLLDDHEVDALAEAGGFGQDEIEQILADIRRDGFSVS